tara:strand:- start:1150 stop:1299 length:150 start_codon:yes stop_codon:yes gene_type:complete
MPRLLAVVLAVMVRMGRKVLQIMVDLVEVDLDIGLILLAVLQPKEILVG